MTGKGHRIVTFMAVGGVTGSPLAAALSSISSTLPDSLEYLLFGSARNRCHRGITHWFIPWLGMAAFCFYSAMLPPESEDGVEGFLNGIVPRAADIAAGDWRFAWACAAFCFLGPLMHIIEDAFCGKVPFLFPWRRSVGIHLFRASSTGVTMIYGERIFTFMVCLFSLAAWFGRGLVI